MSRQTSLIICCLEASNENKNVNDDVFESIRNNEIKNIMRRESSPYKQVKTDQDWGLIFEKSCEFNRFEFLKWIQTTMSQNFSDILSPFVEQGFTKACANNHLNVMYYLLDNFDHEIFDFNEAFVAACCEGSLDVVKFLYTHHSIDDNNDGFVLACANGHLNVVKYLLETHKFNPTKDRNKPIRHASDGGWYEVVKLLLTLEKYSFSENDQEELVTVDPSDFNNGAISNAAENGHENVVDLLLADERVDATNSGSHTAFFNACVGGHVNILKKILNWYEANEKIIPESQSWLIGNVIDLVNSFIEHENDDNERKKYGEVLQLLADYNIH
jgi:ankyrin repeat protein